MPIQTSYVIHSSTDATFDLAAMLITLFAAQTWFSRYGLLTSINVSYFNAASHFG